MITKRGALLALTLSGMALQGASAQKSFPTISARTYTTGSAVVTVTGSFSYTADIPISGSYNGTFDRIEARAVVMSGTGNNGSSTAWSTIDDALSAGTFSGTLSDVPAGGWYQIEVRSVTGGTPSQPSTVTRIGVGDIYLTCGQSNAANRGTPPYSPNVDRFSALHYSTGSWSLAADPMPGASVTHVVLHPLA